VTTRASNGRIQSDISVETFLDKRDEFMRAGVKKLTVELAAHFNISRATAYSRLWRYERQRARDKAKRVERAQRSVHLCRWCEHPLPSMAGTNERYRYCCVGCALMANVKRDGDCWIWQKSTSHGYGQFSFNAQHERAHKASFQCFSGERVPSGMVVMHMCDNRACINPRHLRLGSYLDNNRDAVSKGRNNRGEGRHSAKLNDEIVRLIRDDTSTSNTDFAKRFGVSAQAIYCARTGATWRHCPMPKRNSPISVGDFPSAKSMMLGWFNRRNSYKKVAA